MLIWLNLTHLDAASFEHVAIDLQGHDLSLPLCPACLDKKPALKTAQKKAWSLQFQTLYYLMLPGTAMGNVGLVPAV